MKMLDEILTKMDIHAKNNGSHQDPAGLATPKSVANEAQKTNEEDSWKKVETKRTV